MNIFILAENSSVPLLNEVVVSSVGQDVAGCGQPEVPCRSLAAGLTAVVDGGSIIVMSGGDNASAWGEFCSDDPLVITRSVTLEGRSTSGPRPTLPVKIGCPPDGTRSLLLHISGIDSGSVKTETINETRSPQNKTGSNFCRNGSAVQSSPFEPTDSVVQVRFLNVHLVKTVLSVSDASVQIDCSRLEDFRWKSVEASRFVELSVRESEATGRVDKVCSVNCSTSSMFEVQGQHVRLFISGSVFRHCPIEAVARKLMQADVSDCLFTGLDSGSENKFLSGLAVGSRNEEQPSWIRVSGTRFEGLMHNDPVQSIKNIDEASLRIRVSDTKKNVLGSNVTVSIQDCTFGSGERGITIIGPYDLINITNSRFHTNIAMHHGAGILFLVHPESIIVVDNCTFWNNEAGRYRPEQLKDYTESFQVKHYLIYSKTISTAC